MPKAVIAAEDNKFYTHGGVDYMGVFRAAITNYRRGKISQGASTVTQQLARNSFDSPELHARTYQRKLVEMFLAQRIEANFSKNQIMELYANHIFLGANAYGVEAGADPVTEGVGVCRVVAWVPDDWPDAAVGLC